MGAVEDNLKLGREAGEEIRAEAGEKFFEELMAYVQDIQVLLALPHPPCRLATASPSEHT